MVGTCDNCGNALNECECKENIMCDKSCDIKDCICEVESVNLVKNPASTHYELWQGTEVIDVIKEMLTPEEYRGFLKGNILKYQLRLGKKDATDKEIIKIKDYQRELNESLTSSRD